MSTLWLEVALVLVLIGVNAVLAGSEMAFVTLRESQIERLESRGRKGAAVGRLARDPNRFLATVQIGITLAGFLASATAAVSLAEPLVGPLSFMGEAAEPAAIVTVTLVLSYLSLVFGELAPKRVAMQRAEGWVTLFARPLVATASLARPLVWALSRSTDVAVRLLGGDPSVRKEEMTKDEVREVIAARPGFHKIERTIMSGALDIADRTLREICVPRTSIISVRAADSAEEAAQVLKDAGISRAPVSDQSIDDIIGIVHFRDLVEATRLVRDVARPAVALPESASVMKALSELQKSRTHMAIVVDEYGGTEGIVTVEDVLEEIVGELYDEFDRDTAQVVRDSKGAIVLPGSFPVHDLQDLKINIPSGEYTTLTGLLMDRLGRMPQRGDQIHEGQWVIEVVAVTDRSVERVRLHRGGRTKTS